MKKKIAIMQPYFLPYIGYFQLINAVDEFIIYDNIQFSKGGWFHRNRILQNEKDVYISLPIKKDSDFLDIKERYLADSFEKEKLKLISKIRNNYKKAPFFESCIQLIESVFESDDKNLFQFIYQSLIKSCEHLNIATPIIVSSTINIDHTLRKEHKVKALVKERKGEVYINPSGGKELYDKEDFKKDGIDLKFIQTKDITYNQYIDDFIPFLSIIDVLMFNELETVKKLLDDFSIQ